MCGRFEILSYEEVASIVDAVENRVAATRIASGEPRAQAHPGDSVLLFGCNSDDGITISESVWGFTPEWGSKTIFNTRIESARSESGMWRTAIQEGRCIIPAASFFEPHATEMARSPRTGRPIKRQYRFSSPEGEPLLFAGVQQDGRCSVVTCSPNRWVSPIHDRMPLILSFREVGTWLSPAWPELSDCGAIELIAEPETPELRNQPDQLTLF